MNKATVRLTQYSHGAGCGCKLAPSVLQRLLRCLPGWEDHPALLVGARGCDDAAVLQLTDSHALVATTDFFLPIVDDPYDFGWIAAANAVSDVYAMGARPVLALGLLGWPIDRLDDRVAARVLQGAAELCRRLHLPLAGGHSIDNPEPLFGLAVNGWVSRQYLKTNAGARPGDVLFLSKPLGVGLITTAQKRGKADPADYAAAIQWMKTPNHQGEPAARQPGVQAMTDVTGFGLLGHLLEMCEASGTAARLNLHRVPLIASRIHHYVQEGLIPGGTRRNLASYGERIRNLPPDWAPILADPQTSGGLLIAVDPAHAPAFARWWQRQWPTHPLAPIGRFISSNDPPFVEVDLKENEKPYL